MLFNNANITINTQERINMLCTVEKWWKPVHEAKLYAAHMRLRH